MEKQDIHINRLINLNFKNTYHGSFIMPGGKKIIKYVNNCLLSDEAL